MTPLREPQTHKAAPPLETIRRVRGLLAGLDVFTVETFHLPAREGATYSCRLELGDEPFLGAGFSVNGKGMSARWALASAYGELMERLECGALLTRFPGRSGDLTTVLPDVFARECPEAFVLGMGVPSREALVGFLTQAWQGEPIHCLPFRDVLSGRQVLLPDALVRELCGTTGLCAGNTRDEAMLQGLMEIFERYATRKLYQYRLTPPQVPESLFEGTGVLGRLHALGLRYSIRDCSLGKGFPVLGLILTLPDDRRAVRLGAAVSPVTARQFFTQYCETLATGGGAWPDSTIDGEPSYPFTGFGQTDFDGDAAALRHFTQLAAKFGGRLYARDCDTLGFPAFRLYMPGASEAFLNFTLTRRDYVLWRRLHAHRETVLRLPRASAYESSTGGNDMTITKTMDGGNLTLLVEGRLNANTAPELETALDASLDGVTSLTFDLQGLAYLSSAGLRVLLACQKRMAKQGAMRVVHVCDDVMDVFKITGFTDILTIE